ncbi:MAG: hypothetical protein KGL54_14190, partial [Sphingomonadales bacterium]|nr:hypothetical protein [Sphingomonadales bacterium]
MAEARSRATTARVRSRRFIPRYAIPSEWWMMAPAMLIAVLVHGSASRSLPPFVSGICVIAAALLALTAPLVARFERGRSWRGKGRWLLIGAVVIVPMFLFGFAMSLWIVRHAAGGWNTGPAVLVMIGTLVGIVCSGRLPTMVSALLALWFAHALVTLEEATMLGLVIGAGVGVYISIRQLEFNRQAQAQLEQVERSQQRA